VAEDLEAEGQLRRGEQQLSGWLRVAASVGFGTRVLRPHVHSFLAAHPGVKIDLKLNDGFIDLVEHSIDLADSTLVARRIGRIRRAVVASRAHVQAATPERPIPSIPEDLKRHPCIVHTELRSRHLWEFSTPDGSTVSVRVEGPLQTNASDIVRAAVLDGVGIAFSPTWLFQDLIDAGDVQVLLPAWQTSPLPLHLVSPPQRRHAAKVRAFSEHLAAALADGSMRRWAVDSRSAKILVISQWARRQKVHRPRPTTRPQGPEPEHRPSRNRHASQTTFRRPLHRRHRHRRFCDPQRSHGHDRGRPLIGGAMGPFWVALLINSQLEGAGSTAAAEMAQPEHRFHALFTDVRLAVRGVCRFCAKNYGVLDAVQAAELTLLEDDREHASLRALLLEGRQIITY
jgi:DNA-binding transcriptional LysR family regulator